MIGDYFMKAPQAYKLFRFHNIILGIHEDDIPVYNVSRRAFLEEHKIKLEKYKIEAHKSD